MNLLALVVISKLIIFSNASWADTTTAKNATAPYYCNGLQLKSAQTSPDQNLKSYEFSGICSVRETAPSGWVYQRTWLEVKARWDATSHTATEYSEVTAGGSGDIRVSMKCDDDPWVTNAKCVIKDVVNNTKIDNFGTRFKVRKKQAGVTLLAGYPPIARHVTNPEQVAQLQQHQRTQSVQAQQNNPVSHQHDVKQHSMQTHDKTHVKPKTQSHAKSNGSAHHKHAVQHNAKPVKHQRVVQQPVPTLTKPLQHHAKKSHPTPIKTVAKTHGHRVTVQEAEKVFDNPTYKGHRIAWCYRWGSQCGKIAADAWCKFNKYSHAKTYKIAYNLGKTLILGDNRLCLHRTCAGFSKITCEKKNKNIVKLKRKHK